MVEEAALGQAGGAAEVVDGGGLVAPRPDQVDGRVEEPAARFVPGRAFLGGFLHGDSFRWDKHTNWLVWRQAIARFSWK
jgi:hypothetical protein